MRFFDYPVSALLYIACKSRGTAPRNRPAAAGGNRAAGTAASGLAVKIIAAAAGSACFSLVFISF